MLSLDQLKERLQSGSDSSQSSEPLFTFKNQGKLKSNTNRPWETNSDKYYKDYDMPDKKDGFEQSLLRAQRERANAQKEASFETMGEKFSQGKILEGLADAGAGLIDMFAHIPSDIETKAYMAGTGRDLLHADEEGNVPDEPLNPLQRAAAAGEAGLMSLGLGEKLYRGVSGAGRLAKAANIAKGVEKATTKEAAAPFAEMAEKVLDKGWAKNPTAKLAKNLGVNAGLSAGEGAAFTALENIQDQGEVNEHLMDNAGNMVAQNLIMGMPLRALGSIGNYSSAKKLNNVLDDYQNLTTEEWAAKKQAQKTLNQNRGSKSLDAQSKDYNNKYLNTILDAHKSMVEDYQSKETATTNYGFSADETLNPDNIKTNVGKQLVNAYHDETNPNSKTEVTNGVIGKQNEGGLNNYGTFGENGESLIEALENKDEDAINQMVKAEIENRNLNGQEPIYVSYKSNSNAKPVRLRLSDISSKDADINVSTEMFNSKESENPSISFNKNNIDNSRSYIEHITGDKEKMSENIEKAGIGKDLLEAKKAGKLDIMEGHPDALLVDENGATLSGILNNAVDDYRHAEKLLNENRITQAEFSSKEDEFYKTINEIYNILKKNNKGDQYIIDSVRQLRDMNKKVFGEEVGNALDVEQFDKDAIKIASTKDKEVVFDTSEEFKRNNESEAQMMIDEFSYAVDEDVAMNVVGTPDYDECLRLLNAGRADKAKRIINSNEQLKGLYSRCIARNQLDAGTGRESIWHNAKLRIQKLVWEKIIAEGLFPIINDNGILKLNFEEPDTSLTAEENVDSMFRNLGEAFAPYADVVIEELKSYSSDADNQIPKFKKPKPGKKYKERLEKAQIEYGKEIASEMFSNRSFDVEVSLSTDDTISLFEFKNKYKVGDISHSVSDELSYFVEMLIQGEDLVALDNLEKYNKTFEEIAPKITELFNLIRNKYFNKKTFKVKDITDIFYNTKIPVDEKERLIQSLQEFGHFINNLLGEGELYKYGIRNIGDLLTLFPDLYKANTPEKLQSALNKMQLNIKTKNTFAKFFKTGNELIELLYKASKIETSQETIRLIYKKYTTMSGIISNIEDLNNNSNIVIRSLCKVATDHILAIRKLMASEKNNLFSNPDNFFRNGGHQALMGLANCLDIYANPESKYNYESLVSRLKEYGLSLVNKETDAYIERFEKQFPLHLMSGLGEQVNDVFSSNNLETIRKAIPEERRSFFVDSENLSKEFNNKIVKEVYAGNVAGLMRDMKNILKRNLTISTSDSFVTNNVQGDAFTLPRQETNSSYSITSFVSNTANSFRRLRNKISDLSFIRKSSFNDNVCITMNQLKNNLTYVKFHLIFEDVPFIKVQDNESFRTIKVTPADLYNTIVKPAKLLDSDAILNDKQKIEIVSNDYSLLQEFRDNVYGMDANGKDVVVMKSGQSLSSIFEANSKIGTPEKILNEFASIANNSQNAVSLRVFMIDISNGIKLANEKASSTSVIAQTDTYYKQLITSIAKAAWHDYFEKSNNDGKRILSEQTGNSYIFSHYILKLYNQFINEISNAEKSRHGFNTRFNFQELENNIPNLNEINIRNIKFYDANDWNKTLNQKSQNKFTSNGSTRNKTPHKQLLLRSLFTNDRVMSWNVILSSENMTPDEMWRDICEMANIDPELRLEVFSVDYITDNDISREFKIMNSNGEPEVMTKDKLAEIRDNLLSLKKNNRKDKYELSFSNDYYSSTEDIHGLTDFLSLFSEIKDNLANEYAPEEIITSTLRADNPKTGQIITAWNQFVSDMTAYLYSLCSVNNIDLSKSISPKFVQLLCRGVFIVSNGKTYRTTIDKIDLLPEEIRKNISKVEFTLADPENVADRCLSIIQNLRHNKVYQKLTSPKEKILYCEQEIQKDYFDEPLREVVDTNLDDILSMNNYKNTVSYSQAKNFSDINLNPPSIETLLSNSEQKEFTTDPLNLIIDSSYKKKNIEYNPIIKEWPDKPSKKNIEGLYNYIRNCQAEKKECILSEKAYIWLLRHLDRYGYQLRNASRNKDGKSYILHLSSKKDILNFCAPDIERGGANVPVFDVVDSPNVSGLNIVLINKDIEENTYSATEQTLKNTKHNISATGDNAEVIHVGDFIDAENFDIDNFEFVKSDNLLDVTNSIKSTYGEYGFVVSPGDDAIDFVKAQAPTIHQMDVSPTDNRRMIQYSTKNGTGIPASSNILGFLIMPWSQKAIEAYNLKEKYLVLPIRTKNSLIGIDRITLSVNPENSRPGDVVIEFEGNDSLNNLKDVQGSKFDNIHTLPEHLNEDRTLSVDYATKDGIDTSSTTSEGSLSVNQKIINYVYSIAMDFASRKKDFSVFDKITNSSFEDTSFVPKKDNLFLSRSDRESWLKIQEDIEGRNLRGLSDNGRQVLINIIKNSVRYNLNPSIFLTSNGIVRVRPKSLLTIAKYYKNGSLSETSLLNGIQDLYNWISGEDFYNKNFTKDGKFITYTTVNGRIIKRPVSIAITRRSFAEEYSGASHNKFNDTNYSNDLNNYAQKGYTNSWDEMITHLISDEAELSKNDLRYVSTPEQSFVCVSDAVPNLKPTITGYKDPHTNKDYNVLYEGFNRGFKIAKEKLTDDEKKSKDINDKTVLTEDLDSVTNPEVIALYGEIIDFINEEFLKDVPDLELSRDNTNDLKIVTKLLATTSGWTASLNDEIIFNLSQLEKIKEELFRTLKDKNNAFVGFNPNEDTLNSFFLDMPRIGDQEAHTDIRIKTLVYDPELRAFLKRCNIDFADVNKDKFNNNVSSVFRNYVLNTLNKDGYRDKRKILISLSNLGDNLYGVPEDDITKFYNYSYASSLDDATGLTFAMNEWADPDSVKEAHDSFRNAIKRRIKENETRKATWVPDAVDGTYHLKLNNMQTKAQKITSALVKQLRFNSVLSGYLAVACRIDSVVRIPVQKLHLLLGKKGYLPMLSEFRTRVNIDDGILKSLYRTDNNKLDPEVVAMFKLLKLFSEDKEFYIAYMKNDGMRETSPTELLEQYVRNLNQHDSTFFKEHPAIEKIIKGYEDIRDKGMGFFTGENFMLPDQIDIYLQRMMLELGNNPELKNILESRAIDGTRRIDAAISQAQKNNEQWKLVRDLGVGADWLGDTKVESTRALEASKANAMAQQNLISYAFNYCTSNKPLPQLLMTLLGTKFLNATMNMSGRVLEKFIPVIRPAYYLLIDQLTREEPIVIESGPFKGRSFRGLGKVIVDTYEGWSNKKFGYSKIERGNEARFIKMLTESSSKEHMEALKVYTSLREALFSNLSVWGMNVLGMGIAGASFFQSPEDDKQKDDYRNYTIAGMPVELAWWCEDVFGPAFVIGAFFKSVTEGNSRPQIIFNGIKQLCVNNPLFKVDTFLDFILNPEKHIEEQSQELNGYENAEGGKPSSFITNAYDWPSFAMNTFNGLLIPMFSRDMADFFVDTEKSYKRRPLSTPTGNTNRDAWENEGKTEKTNWFDAQIRKTCRNNYFFGAVMSFLMQDPTYNVTNMPDVQYTSQAQLQSKKMYGLTGKDGQEQNQIIWEIISILNDNDDMDELYHSGFYLDEATKIKVKQTLYDWYMDVVKEYEDVRDQGYLNFYSAGNGDFEAGRQKVIEYNKDYTDLLSKIRGIAGKLYSPELNQGLQTYKMYNTTWRKDSNGKMFASGIRHGGLLNLLPVQFGDMGGTDLTANANGEFASISKLNDKEMFTEEGEPLRALLPNSKTRGDTKLESWGTHNPVSTSATSSSSKSYSSGYSSARKGGSGGGSKSIYSHLPNLNVKSSSTPRSTNYRAGQYDYLKPEYYTQGSRYAYRKNSL